MTDITIDDEWVPDWWPERGSLEEAVWAERTLDVVQRVTRRAANNLRGLYHYGGIERDDLESYLTARAIEFRDEVRDLDPENGTALDQWCRILYKALLERSYFHFVHTHRIGVSSDSVRSILERQDSADRPLPSGETVGTLGHGLWSSATPVDPLDHLVKVEELQHVLLSKYGIKVKSTDLTVILTVLDKVAPDPGAGQCSVWGCPQPPAGGTFTSAGLCSKHYYRKRKEDAEPCTEEGCERPQQARRMCSMHYSRWLAETRDPCTVEGCSKPQNARGLCSMHYHRARKAGEIDLVRNGDLQAHKKCVINGCPRLRHAKGLCATHYKAHRLAGEGTCGVKDCTKRQIARGLCHDHYRQVRQAEAQPCSVDGCDKPSRSRGMCASHYNKALDAEAQPCTVDGCDKPQRAKGMCMTHYRKATKPTDPCIEENCTDVQFATGLCRRHYRISREAS